MTDDRLCHLHEVATLLWPAPLRVSIGSSGPTAEPAHAEYLVLPSGRRPRLLVPRNAWAAAGAVRRYGVGRGRGARRRTAVLAQVMATGLAPMLVRGRVRVVGTAGEHGSIETHLAELLGRQVLVSMYLGAPRANRKPVLQVLTPRGRTIAYAKVGVDPLTRRLVRDEAAALNTLAGVELRGLTVPRVLHSGSWNDLELLVQAALPVGGRASRPDRQQVLDAQVEVAGVGRTPALPLAASPYWAGLVERVGRLIPAPTVDRLSALVAEAENRLGHVELPLGSWHGDWTPWNTAQREGRLLVWDWERFTTGVPAGYDALHWTLQSNVVNRLHDPRKAAERLLVAPPDLAPFGLSAQQARATAAAYLVEIASRYLADQQQEAGARLGDVAAWLLPALESAVLDRQVHPAHLRARRGMP